MITNYMCNMYTQEGARGRLSHITFNTTVSKRGAGPRMQLNLCTRRPVVVLLISADRIPVKRREKAQVEAQQRDRVAIRLDELSVDLTGARLCLRIIDGEEDGLHHRGHPARPVRP